MTRASHTKQIQWDWFERIVFGPEAPVGRAYRPGPSLRCRVGLHRYVQVWDFTLIRERHEDGHIEAQFSVNLDRTHDYVECCRCQKMLG